MATYPAKGGADFVKVSEGTHLAVCTLVADVGLQPGSKLFPDPKIRVFLRFEVPSERIEYEKDGELTEGPAVIYHNWSASMNAKANMRKAIESWRGAKFTDSEAEQFDIRKLLGRTCLLQVVHSDDGKYANVSNIMAPPKGTAALKPEGVTIYFGPDDDAAYDALPKFLREKWDNQVSPALSPAPKPDAKPKTEAQRAESASKAAAFDDGAPFVDDLTIPF
jgi:hypothetical protein